MPLGDPEPRRDLPPGPASSRRSGFPGRPVGEGPSCPGGTGIHWAAHVPTTGRLSRAPGARQATSAFRQPCTQDCFFLEGLRAGPYRVGKGLGAAGASSATNDRLRLLDPVLRGSSDSSPSTNRWARRQGWTRANRPAIRPMANHTDTHAPADVWPRMWAGASCCAETGLRLIHVCSVSTNQALAAALRPVERGFAWLKSWRIFCRSRRSPQPHGVTHQELPSGWWQVLSKNDR